MAAVSAAAANSHIFCKEIHGRDQQQQVVSGAVWFSSSPAFCGENYWKGKKRKMKGNEWKVKAAFWQNTTRPDAVQMEPITDVNQFDQILTKAQEISQPIIIEWMASWCRKCIYLKPKLEKLAAEYNSKMKFYCVDVNKVPQALVKRGNISKMPTIQLWKDGEMKEEIIGGHKAWIVMDEVREMIQKYV